MLSNKFGAIAGAAMLGTAALLGTNAAYAIKVGVGTTVTDDAVIYATETVTEASAIDKDGVKYYNLLKDHLFRAPYLVGSREADDWTVAVEFSGMVLSDGNASVATCLPVEEGQRTILTTTCMDVEADNVRTLIGGAKGDDNVTFLITGEVLDTAEPIEVTARLAISAAGSGSVKITVTNLTLANLNTGTFTKSDARSGVVKVMSALDEMADGADVIATVATGFKKFAGGTSGGVSVDSLGSFGLGLKALLNATVPEGDDFVDSLDDLIDVVPTGTPPKPSSTATITGDFSFASKVHLDTSPQCGTTTAEDLLIRDEDDMVSNTEMLEVVDVADFHETALAASVMHLCVTVDSDDEDLRIPETSNYLLTTSYKKISGRAFGPDGMESMLGMILRDGTTVRFPYLTIRDGYVQRIRIVSRAADAKYSMSFADNAEAMAMAEGTLDKGRTTLMVSELVSINDGSITSGTLVIEAQPGMIDIASTLNTPGGTDTVMHTK